MNNNELPPQPGQEPEKEKEYPPAWERERSEQALSELLQELVGSAYDTPEVTGLAKEIVAEADPTSPKNADLDNAIYAINETLDTNPMERAKLLVAVSVFRARLWVQAGNIDKAIANLDGALDQLEDTLDSGCSDEDFARFGSLHDRTKEIWANL